MSKLTEIKWRYMLHHTYFRVCNGAELSLGKNVCIKNSRIIVTPGSSIRIGDGVVIENAEISVVDGSVSIGEYVRIGHTKDSTLINVECGRMRVDHHTKIAARRVWIRFGGDLSIGCYTNINSNSEIRCDERISIGNFNQISYEVNIWDTNTHNILPKGNRREIAQKFWPYFGKETEKPITKPVIIGDDCWLGERVSILKGSIIGDEVIVGYNTTIPGKNIQSKSTVVSEISLKTHIR